MSTAFPARCGWNGTGGGADALGQLPFFIDFLKTSGLFEAFVAACPLRYRSPNAAKKRDVLGTVMLSMLAGPKRDAHIAARRRDGVLPELLGLSRTVSEDAVRRGLKAIDEEEGADGLRRHLGPCVEPLLSEPWILDVGTTIKPLYGHPQGAKLGYNPKKPGRPSHCYHSYSMAGTRLVLDVEVSPGDEQTSKHSAPGLGSFLDGLPRDLWPTLLRGDSGFGNEPILPEVFAPPAGNFLLILRKGETIGGGAFKRYDEATAEFKRIWTRADLRRQGLARVLLTELEPQALRQGYSRVYLTTGFRQPEATGLYLTSGYRALYDPGADLEALRSLPFEKVLRPERRCAMRSVDSGSISRSGFHFWNMKKDD